MKCLKLQVRVLVATGSLPVAAGSFPVVAGSSSHCRFEIIVVGVHYVAADSFWTLQDRAMLA